MAAEKKLFEDREERDTMHWSLVEAGFAPHRFSYADPECLTDDSKPLKIVWGLTWGEEIDL